MNKTIITWNTTKTDAGFCFNVISMSTRQTPNASGQYADSTILQTGYAKSRAIARSNAQKWVRYLKSQQEIA